MVGKVAVQAFPIETIASSSKSAPPVLPASAAQFDVGRPSEPPTSELQEVAESDQLLLGYVFVTKSVGKRFKQGDKKVWEETMRSWTWSPEGYRIHPRPLIPKSQNNQPSVLSRFKFKLFKSTDDYDMSRNQWTCKVNFRYPKEVLAKMDESTVTIEVFKKDIQPGEVHLATGTRPKWSDEIVISHDDHDFMLWFAWNKLGSLRICDCEPQVQWREGIDQWKIPEWENMFPSLAEAVPQAKMRLNTRVPHSFDIRGKETVLVFSSYTWFTVRKFNESIPTPNAALVRVGPDHGGAPSAGTGLFELSTKTRSRTFHEDAVDEVDGEDIEEQEHQEGVGNLYRVKENEKIKKVFEIDTESRRVIGDIASEKDADRSVDLSEGGTRDKAKHVRASFDIGSTGVDGLKLNGVPYVVLRHEAWAPGPLCMYDQRVECRRREHIEREQLSEFGTFHSRIVHRRRVRGARVGPDTLLSTPAPFSAFRERFVAGETGTEEKKEAGKEEEEMVVGVWT
ncbi:hypothetical protein EV360DRAFT_74782 [Lentinula raphanica]|nr:hypothetical protein EV360DRAFT_74782 [Lentinula raphanica]